jgi:hypothetical protein
MLVKAGSEAPGSVSDASGWVCVGAQGNQGCTGGRQVLSGKPVNLGFNAAHGYERRLMPKHQATEGRGPEAYRGLTTICAL